MMEPNCKYFLKHKREKEKNKVFAEFGGKMILCDNYNCCNNSSKIHWAEFEIETGSCGTNGYIENGIPVDKDGKVIDLTKVVGLESKVDKAKVDKDGYEEVDFSGQGADYEGIKPTDLKNTSNSD